MVPTCSVYGCKNRYDKSKNISFHKRTKFKVFPSIYIQPSLCCNFLGSVSLTDGRDTVWDTLQGADAKTSVTHLYEFPLARPEVCAHWVTVMKSRGGVKNYFKPTKYSNICSQHFTQECFKRGCNNRILKENAVPSLFGLRTQEVESSIQLLQTDEKQQQEVPIETTEGDAPVDHDYAWGSAGRQRRRVLLLQEQVASLRRRLRTSQQRCRRQEQQLRRMKEAQERRGEERGGVYCVF